MNKTPSHRAQITLTIVILLIVVALAGVAGLAMRSGSAGGDALGSPDIFLTRRGGFDITIPVTGELAALRQIEIRNQLDNRAIITEIVPEGTFVNKGDVLLRLNDDEVRTELRAMQDKVNVAEAALIAATAELEIAQKTREAELKKAKLAITLAELALQAWREGELLSKRQELDLAIKTAEKEYDRLRARFEESGSLLEKKFISLDEWKRDEIAMMQAEATLKQARLDLEVYEKYTYEQEKAQKESDLDQAISEYDRIEEQYDAEVRSAQSNVDSKTFQLESAKEELAELQQQLAHCTVTAPSSGLVVYYSSLQGNSWRNEGRPPQVGTELSRNEPVIILPDTSQMIAAVKVSEVLSGLIQPRQRAIVVSDAVPDRPLSGEVMSVGVMAESGGWRDPNRREYTVRILLHEGSDLGLKPSMRCKATIYVGRVDDALYVPVQGVFRNGPLTYVYVPASGGYAQQKVSLGRSSELYVEVLEGLTEGQPVLLREPRPEEIVSRLPVPKRKTDEGQSRSAEQQDSAPSEAPASPPGMEQPNSGGPGGPAGLDRPGAPDQRRRRPRGEQPPTADDQQRRPDRGDESADRTDDHNDRSDDDRPSDSNRLGDDDPGRRPHRDHGSQPQPR